MIELKDVSKRFGNINVLNALTMHVPTGAVYGLIGPNGAGKTTTMRHMCGAVMPDSGQVLIAGEPVFDNPNIKAAIATIQSEPYYYARATVHDMERLYADLYASFDKQRFAKLLNEFDIDGHMRVRYLSKGLQKQAAFLLALARRPRVLLLDEPADGLDPLARHKVWSLVMDQVAEKGMTVVASSHNLRELSDVCDHVGILDQGHMSLEYSLEQLQESFAKVQVAYDDDKFVVPRQVEIMSQTQQGRLFTLVVKGRVSDIEAAFSATSPTFFNLLPLSLEEFFISELGGSTCHAISE